MLKGSKTTIKAPLEMTSYLYDYEDVA